MAVGLSCAIAAHTLWGLFPIYWRQLSHVDSLELVWHRIWWSFVLLLLGVPWMLLRSEPATKQAFLAAITSGRVWALYTAAAVLIAINWFAFIWAVNHDRVLEASLGYYINPLFNVMLGVFVLGERLRRPQWLAVGIAAVGVTIMSVASGGLPWVSLAMASAFAGYALVKKKTPLPPLQGLWFELTILAIPAAWVIGSRMLEGSSALNHSSLQTKVLLIAGGVVTVAPLTLFAAAVQRVDLSTIGILQYIGPTLQFLVGAFLFGEPLYAGRLIGFGFVWIGLVVFVAGPLKRARQKRQQRIRDPLRKK